MAMSIADILNQWDAVGVFDYMLPFLLVFAIVFGILSSTKFLGKNKTVYVVISVVIGLMALRWNFLGDFLNELFPRLGIGLGVILAVLILVGMFVARDESRYWGWGLAAIGFITALTVILRTFDAFSWYGFSYTVWGDYIGYIIGAVLLVGVIIAVAASNSKDTDKEKGKARFLGGWGQDRP